MLEILAETESTNRDLIGRIESGDRVTEGHWLIANRQTGGRGRLGRSWENGEGNFMGSTVVHISHGDPDPATLALVAGLALFETVSKHTPSNAELRLKWPNDLLLDGAKLAGILLERTGDAIVAGIGVNLTCAPEIEGVSTASLADIGISPSRDRFAEDLAKQLEVEVGRWRTTGLAPIIGRWTKCAHPVGTPLRVTEPGGTTLEGTFAGLDDTGALQLRLADGTMHVIHAGDVFLAGNGD